MDVRIDSFSAVLNSLPSIAREGLLIHAQRLPASARTLLLPRQLAYYYADSTEHADSTEAGAPDGFVCGVSGRNLLPAVNFCQDIRAWRARLERHGIKVVKAASFSGRSQRDHLRFARKIGYPVVLKPVIRNTLYEEYVKEIKREAELDFLFSHSRELKKNKASDLAASPYAMTRLSEDHVDEHGRRYLPLSVRYMVEKQLEGEQLRLIMADGQVAAAFHKRPEHRAWQTVGALHASYRALGEKVAAVMQGMAYLRIDLIVDDATREAQEGNHAVIALSEHLKCYKLYHDHPVESQRLLERVAGGASDRPLEAPMQFSAVLAGISHGPRLEKELVRTTQALGLELILEELDEVTGRVRFQAAGPAWAGSALTWVYANGLGIEEVPTSVDVTIVR
ncbi:hypothetical protein [Halomonas sp. JS92-SW72]|uniref:hypothetical protein n=1 Tax=Halomonas sp. JS92-SW72 TaxID=2306583 RepID=UPI000E5B595F|nr:hypothetical protein [Halomonas sp. JS92-SW72]AXY41421.1 hypothetical protein D1793_03990 [Halomonas sp. JS92-SW72]